jgi:hypothetical protein
MKNENISCQLNYDLSANKDMAIQSKVCIKTTNSLADKYGSVPIIRLCSKSIQMVCTFCAT